MSDGNTNLLTKPSVQDVLDQLLKVEDKSQPFEVDIWDADGFNIDYSSIEIKELVTSDGTPSSVCLEVAVCGEVRQTWPETELDAEEEVNTSAYEEKHRPQNQLLVEGIPVNPTLRPGFECTDNDYREELEISDWWGRPFIRVYSWVDMASSYSDYLDRVGDLENFEPVTQQQYEQEQSNSRSAWFKSWPSGLRYDVRCLDGGAWDRSTNIAQVGELQDALNIAKSLQNNT